MWFLFQTRRLSEAIEFLFNLKRLLVDLLEEFFPLLKLAHCLSIPQASWWCGLVCWVQACDLVYSTVSPQSICYHFIAERSEIEWEFVKIYVAWNSADFRSKSSNLVGKHAWCRDLNGIIPIVVVVTKCVGKVENSHLWNLRWVLCNIEVSGLHRSLGHRVWHKEEVKLSVNNFRLLNKSCVNIGSLWWVHNRVGSIWMWRLLEESLTNSLVDND